MMINDKNIFNVPSFIVSCICKGVGGRRGTSESRVENAFVDASEVVVFEAQVVSSVGIVGTPEGFEQRAYVAAFPVFVDGVHHQFPDVGMEPFSVHGVQEASRAGEELSCGVFRYQQVDERLHVRGVFRMVHQIIVHHHSVGVLLQMFKSFVHAILS